MQDQLAAQREGPVECLSGLDGGITLGTPIALVVRNEDQKPAHYADMAQVCSGRRTPTTRTFAKYGVRAASGGGRASARETIGRVAGAAVAEQILERLCPAIAVVAWVDSVKGDAQASPIRRW